MLLDTKAVFDVVNRKHMMRRLYHCGIYDAHWSLINNLHTNARTSVKWMGNVSESYLIEQGIHQGGIISTDMNKVYVNPCYKGYSTLDWELEWEILNFQQ